MEQTQYLPVVFLGVNVRYNSSDMHYPDMHCSLPHWLRGMLADPGSNDSCHWPQRLLQVVTVLLLQPLRRDCLHKTGSIFPVSSFQLYGLRLATSTQLWYRSQTFFSAVLHCNRCQFSEKGVQSHTPFTWFWLYCNDYLYCTCLAQWTSSCCSMACKKYLCPYDVELRPQLLKAL